MGASTQLLLADVILSVHVLFVLVVVLLVPLILAGRWTGWRWVRNRYVRVGHILAIGYVVMNTWLGKLCPLTIWENDLRRAAGQEGYTERFISHWLRELLYFDLPLWVFAFVYSAFAGLIIALFWIVPVKWKTKEKA